MEVPAPILTNQTKEETETELAESQGALYQNFVTAQEKLEDLVQLYDDSGGSGASVSRNPSQRRRSLVPEAMPPAALLSEDGRFLQETPKVDFTMASGNIGYKVYDDVAVFKISSFEVKELEVLTGWIGMLNEAAEKGVTKVILDIIGNGGGTVSMGYLLALLMHPEAEYNDFANPNDQLYPTSMEVFWSQIRPLVTNITRSFDPLDQGKFLFDIGPTLNFLNSDLDILVQKLQGVVITLNAIKTISPKVSTIAAAAAAEAILADVNATSFISADQFTLLYSTLNSAFEDLVDDGGQTGALDDGTFSLYASGRNSQTVSYNRGGIVDNYTSAIYISPPDEFAQFKAVLNEIDNVGMFEQYLILSDGWAVGSTACLFQSTNSFFSKSNANARRPVNTVGFGGTGLPQDSSPTQFCGGAVLGSDLSPLWVPDLMLVVLGLLFDGNEEKEDRISKAFADFTAALPEPCYYCNVAPKMPFLEVYSVLVGTNSTPLEYVNQVSDFYIPQWPSGTAFDSSFHLEALYDQAAQFFDQQVLSGEGGGDGGAGGTDGASSLRYMSTSLALSLGIAVLCCAMM